MTTSKRIESPAGPLRGHASALLPLRKVATRQRLGLRTVMAVRAAGKLRVLRFGSAVRVEPAEVKRLIREARS